MGLAKWRLWQCYGQGCEVNSWFLILSCILMLICRTVGGRRIELYLPKALTNILTYFSISPPFIGGTFHAWIYLYEVAFPSYYVVLLPAKAKNKELGQIVSNTRLSPRAK